MATSRLGRCWPHIYKDTIIPKRNEVEKSFLFLLLSFSKSIIIEMNVEKVVIRMSMIQIMDEDLANKIAAGEVVERCMNVVKELVENSIDAKSTEIHIDLIDSGIKEIRVGDNGIGMNKEDAVLAFSRHATSKLKSIEDLFQIHSLGFRGEALPSIAAVSHVVLKTSDGTSGTLVEINGGKLEKVEATDLRQGTIITVSDLFYNTPVRLKYLRNPYAELASITDYINKMALSYPAIKFVLTNNNKILLNTDGSNRLLKVIHAIYGLEVTKKMVEIHNANDDYEISGYISYPEMMKNNRNAITIMVNGRVIKNNEVIRYICDSYHTYMPPDKFPIAVIKIEVDPILVDVNIHPTKMDVKFSKIEALKELILSTISSTLEKLTLIPDAGLKTVSEGNTTKVANYYGTYSLSDREYDIDKKNEEFAQFEKMSLSLEVAEDQDTITNTLQSSLKETEHEEKKEPRIKEMYPVGLVHGTYIVAENEDGMFLIDQHAANERINYEYYLKELSNPTPHKTDLLVPITLEFPSNEWIILKEHLDLLTKMGFEFEDFGFQTLLIRTVPLWLPKGNEELAIRKIMDIITSIEDFSLAKFFDHVAATVACKASIKANDFITEDDMRVLLSRLRACQNPFTCPHGRPTIITYSNYELERLFKRAM